MNSPLINSFRIQIKSLSSFDFQRFIVELFLLKYGTSDFIVLREKKDKGCDGIIQSEKCVISCYGPENYTQAKFHRKAEDDFGVYESNWQTTYPNWMFIVNIDITPKQISKIDSLKAGTPLIGIKAILSIIEGLEYYKKRKLATFLKIDKDLLAKDYLREILDDLLNNSTNNEPREKYERPLYFPDKVKLNYDEEDIQNVLEEYDVVAEYFGYIKDLIYCYEDEDIDKIKHRIILDFSQFSGSFKEKIDNVSKQYLAKYSSEDDDDYRFYIRALLIYIFEQCLIGKKTDIENDTSTSRK